MSKNIWLLGLLFLSTNALALEFNCITQPPTTSFVSRMEGNTLIVKTIHHSGTDYMPIYEGVIVPKDLPYLRRSAELMAKMGSETEFRFPLDRCEIFGEGLFRCGMGESQNISGLEVLPLYIETSKISETVEDQTFESTKVRLGLSLNNFLQVVTMNYQPYECSF